MKKYDHEHTILSLHGKAIRMISIYECWTCNAKLTGDEPEEFFFWCNKECHDQDTRYHISTDDTKPEPEIKVTDPQTEKEQRRAKIRNTLAKINSKVKDQS